MIEGKNIKIVPVNFETRINFFLDISALQILGPTNECQVQQDHPQEAFYEQNKQATTFPV